MGVSTFFFDLFGLGETCLETFNVSVFEVVERILSDWVSRRVLAFPSVGSLGDSLGVF